MSLEPVRKLLMPPTDKAVYFDGVNDSAKVEPFTVYGWNEITIAEWIYAFNPKPNLAWSKFSMIGDYGADYPSTFLGTNNRMSYTSFWPYWTVRKPDGTRSGYATNFISYVNQWIFIVRRFTVDREYSVWINGQKKSWVTVPSDEKTVLEWNPEGATYPDRYKRYVLGANIVFSEHMKVAYAEVRIYNRALTAEEIYNDFLGRATKDGLVLYLCADDATETTWPDRSEYGNDATVYGATPIEVKKSPARFLKAIRRIDAVR